jgi:hypothetical protein
MYFGVIASVPIALVLVPYGKEGTQVVTLKLVLTISSTFLTPLYGASRGVALLASSAIRLLGSLDRLSGNIRRFMSLSTVSFPNCFHEGNARFLRN